MIIFMARVFLLITIFILSFTLYIIAWPVDIKISPWEIAPYPKQEGLLALNNELSKAQAFGVELPGTGPEDIAFDKEGFIYTGLSNGQIIKIQPDGSSFEVYAETGGWPLGLVFDKSGNLYTANAYLGLQKIGIDRKVENLAPIVAGKPATFMNELTLSEDEVIYASNSSYTVGAGAKDAANILIDPKGRIITYDLKTKQANELITDIRFANGVIMSHDQKGLIYGESGTGKLMIYHIKGEKAGTSETIVPRLPGLLDDFSQGSNGKYWIVNFNDGKLLDTLSGSPLICHMVMNLPSWMLSSSFLSQKNSSVISLNDKGEISKYLFDGDAIIPNVSSAVEKDGYLYLGNINTRHIYRWKIN